MLRTSDTRNVVTKFHSASLLEISMSQRARICEVGLSETSKDLYNEEAK